VAKLDLDSSGAFTAATGTCADTTATIA